MKSIVKAEPTLVQSASPDGATPLHAAACALHREGTAWLLDRGADPNRRAHGIWTPLDLAASGRGWGESENPAKFEAVANVLLSRGAVLGSFSAVALGRADWIRARHAEGTLVNPAATDHLVGHVGLFETAVWHDRLEILALLLDLGLDPDERTRVGGTDEIIYSAGGPLFCCVVSQSAPLNVFVHDWLAACGKVWVKVFMLCAAS